MVQQPFRLAEATVRELNREWMCSNALPVSVPAWTIAFLQGEIMNKGYLMAGLLFISTSALAVDSGAVVGGALGAAVGAAVGNNVGGSNGSVLGAAIGAATGVAIAGQNSAQAQPVQVVAPVKDAEVRHEHHDNGRHLGERKHKHDRGEGKNRGEGKR